MANSEWRIYEKLWNKNLKKNDATYVEQIHLKKSLTESYRTETEKFVSKMAEAERNKHVVDKLGNVEFS